MIIDASYHMWFVLLMTALAVISFAREKISLEATSVGLLTALLVFGQLFPLPDANGNNMLNSGALLAGFANPSLVAVLALLVMGQAMIHTEALRVVTQFFARGTPKTAWLSVIAIFVFVMSASAFLNNTPLVIIAIPVLQALMVKVGMSESKVMIPLSYAAILGGMTTLIGSSTNLLVASTMKEMGFEPLGFFDFFFPGAILAGVGFVYVVLILPRMLPQRDSLTRQLVGNEKEFIAELIVVRESPLVGMECEDGKFPKLPDLTIRLIQRAGHLILPPFEGYEIQSGDTLIVGATRKALTELLSQNPGFLLSDEEAEIMKEKRLVADGEEDSEQKTETHILAEIMITPASRMIDMTMDQVGFHRQFGTIVLGIQRRARVVRRRLGRIRLEAGDVLLIAGSRTSVDSLRNNPDMIVLSGSKKDLPAPAKAPVAGGIFLSVIVLAATNIISIPVAAIMGAVLMLATGCLNIRQAARAVDRKIFFLVGSMLALGVAMQVTGGASFIAGNILQLPYTDIPIVMLGVLFLLIAFTTNILSNNACAILFTPIALNLAGNLQINHDLPVDIAYLFVITVIFAANCSFASPIGYQTNLLVMGPGHYRFRDFIKAGVPLILILWATFLLVAKFYYGV